MRGDYPLERRRPGRRPRRNTARRPGAAAGYRAGMATQTTQASPAARAPVRIDGYAPIGDYAVIGNKRTAALVALDGSIDWLALPAFDGPPAFGALLDSRAGGRFTLAPSIPFQARRRYLPGTNVLETTFETAQGSVRVTDAMSMPLARDVDWCEVIRRIDGRAGEVPLSWRVEPRAAYGREPFELERRAGVPLLVREPDVLAVQAHDVGEPEGGHGVVEGRFAVREGDVAVLALSAFCSAPLTFSSRDALLERLDATAERWRRWSAGCRYDGPWREAVLRSALALDLLVEADSGAIAAAATMGLPEKIGGERNFDYRYGWLRDANLTLEAMLRLGYREQVHASLGWILAATERTHPWLRPMYRLDGTPRLPDEQLPLPGYRGSRPVVLGNSAQDQLQLGNFGDVFDMAHHHVETGGSLAPEAGRRLAELADFVCRVWRRADASIWELGDAEHYTQSKLACWLALDRAAALADSGDVPATGAGRWRREAAAIQAYVRERCWSDDLRAYVRSADGDGLDASVLLAVRGSFIEHEDDRFGATIDAIRRELGAGGPLLYRYSGMREQEGAFLACSFWMAEALARTGRLGEAHETMDALVALAGDVGLYSEEIDPASGELLGNLPQALTHLSLINAADTIRAAVG
jgi:GH15 family glucan-1,4-alpha-glucosidase